MLEFMKFVFEDEGKVVEDVGYVVLFKKIYKF